MVSDAFKWTPRKRRAAYFMACEPMRYNEIAKELNITVQTLWNYRQHPEFNRKVGQLAARNDRLRMKTRLVIELKKHGLV